MTAIKELLQLLNDNDMIKLSLNIPEDQENVKEEPYRLRGCVYSTIERMDTEYMKLLQSCDAHSPDYVER